MNRAILKIFPIILVILLICSGCKQSSLIEESFLTDQNSSNAVKYKNGAILLKNNQQYDMENQKQLNNSKPGIGEVNFGPKNINFDY